MTIRLLHSRSKRIHQRRQSQQKLNLETLENRIVLDSTVVFNELMYNPVGDTDDSGEWIELYNQLAVDMDVSEWRLEGGVDFEFPDGTSVPGRGFLMVAAAPASLAGVEPGVEIVGPFSGSLSNGGEEIRLINNDNRVMNVLDYGDGGKWPVGPDGGGVTLAKRDELTASNVASNWTFSPQIDGTPGSSNFIIRDGGQANLEDVFSHSAPKQVLVPSNGTLGDTWKQTDFDDSAWTSGTNGVGYERSSGYEPYIGIDVENEMNGRVTALVRVPFETDTSPADMETLILMVRYDDGFVAFLNGMEVARANMPDTVNWDSVATTTHDDGQAIAGEVFDITAFKNLLNPAGSNVLAIQAANRSTTSSDFLISPELGYTVATIGGGGSGEAPLVINEVTAATGTVSVELRNVSGETIDLDGVILAASGDAGGEHLFASQSVVAGGMVVISETEMGLDLVDDEKLFLYAPNKTSLYDAQPVTNRLRGRSDLFAGRWLYPDAATLGSENSFDFESDIVINEIMYHAQPQLDDPAVGIVFAESDEEWIELFNRGSTTIDLSGWELRDAVRYQFPVGTTIAPGEYLVVARDSVTLAEKYPDIDIVGDFSGTLGNAEDNVVLVDAAANPADSVHYFERGQWPSAADGGGSSLELRNPLADNATPGAWAASDEASKSEWQTFTIRRTSSEPMQFGTSYNEFILGLLDQGEFLIDDISVVEDPNGANVQVIQNGSFQSDAIGGTPSKWRLIGTHRGTVQVDPDDPANRVLHVVAVGPQQHVHDHVETTFSGNRSVRDGRMYEIRFRAKWINGSRQLNNRLYFNRMSNTAILPAPFDNGTPGTQNSTYQTNHGPTYSGLAHSPIIPANGQAVTVSVMAEDPDAVETMTLRWRRNGGGWTSVTMNHTGNGNYVGTVPGQSSGQVVQFYVEGMDTRGATTTYPVRGQDSRALYQVNDGRSTTRPIDSLRVILRSADNSQLFSSANRMSNNYVGGTLIRNGEEVFYDIEVRQIGSRFIRPNSGYKVKLSPEHRYFGVHDSIRLDMNGLDEIIYKQMVNRAGGSSVSLYDDITHIVTPQHGSTTILLGLARYEDIFLDEQFENGGDGTKFELDDITYPTDPSPFPEGLKTGTGVSAQDVRYRGSDPENYRGQLLIRNNRSLDDYEPLVEFARVINLNGTALADSVENVMDVDLWMRHYATQAFLGNWDTYGFRRPKNIRLYIRPDDGLVIPMYWDADLANLTEPLIYNGGDSRLDEIRNIPRFSRLFWGHMWDLTNNGFSDDYARDWAAHYSSLGANASGRVGAIGNRYDQARSQAMSAIPVVAFNITTNGGNPITINDTLATIQGDGWIDVREVHDANTGEPLDVEWIDANSWRVRVPVAFGDNLISLEAFDFDGNSISSDSITVTSTSTERPLRDFLRISEINYNPLGSDDTEFIELMNIAPDGDAPLSLSGVQFTDGIQFDFTGADVTTLAPGDRLVVVKDVTAFEAMYGAGLPVAGTFVGSLANEGESIELRDRENVIIHNFEYRDGWYNLTDGDGHTLTSVDPTQELALWNSEAGWRPSETTMGSPGSGDNGVAPNSIVINEVSNNSTESNWIELHNTTSAAIEIGNWYLSDDAVVEQKFQFSAGTLIPAGGFLVLTQDDDFGNPAGPTFFELSALGGELRLRSADATGLPTGYQHGQTYGASTPNMTHGVTGTSDGFVFTVLSGDTRGTRNASPSIGPIVINEIMYNPLGEAPDFIELKNISNSDISLNDGEQSWHFTQGIAFDFPIGASIAAGGFAVLIEGDATNPQQPEEFRVAFDVPPNVPIYVYDGATAGVLDNGGEWLTVSRSTPLVAAAISVDGVRYDDDPPWPTSADGGGPSLSKTIANAFGNDPAAWAAGSASGTPGRENMFLDETAPSDPFDLVGQIVGEAQLALAWAPSFDAETDIDVYNIYRDGELVTTSRLPWFLGPVDFDSGSSVIYEVSAVNGDGIESHRSGQVTIGSQSVSFQQGVGGYSGATDAEIREGSPNSNNGRTDNNLEVDGDDSGSELAILLRWQDISIPAGAQVVGASFTVNITNSGHQYDISRVNRDWDEGEVTWNQAANGQSWQTAGAKGASDSGPLVGSLVGGVGSNTIDLNAAGMAMVESWLADASSNFGILIDSPGGATDGVDMDSREVGNSSNRPKLTIRFLTAGETLVEGDYTLDGNVDHNDIITLCRAIEVGSTASEFDLDGDAGAASQSDLDFLITDILSTTYGDANLDGVTDAADFSVWRSNRFEIQRNWSTGDFNCDSIADGSDFNIWNDNRFLAAAATANPVARTPRAALAGGAGALLPQQPGRRPNLDIDAAHADSPGDPVASITDFVAERLPVRRASNAFIRPSLRTHAESCSHTSDVNECSLVDDLFADW